MPIFGRQKDREFIKSINKEVMSNILDTPVMLFKPYITKTNTNLYGEGTDGHKYWRPGIQINATINREDQEWNNTELGLDISQKITFSFLNEDIWNINTSGSGEDSAFMIDPGDIVFYDSHYWEIDTTNRNQYLFGRNENVSNLFGGNDNAKEGESLSTVAQAHLTRRSKLNIEEPPQITQSGTSNTNEEFQGLYR